jgi:hypothetical protein
MDIFAAFVTIHFIMIYFTMVLVMQFVILVKRKRPVKM